MKAKLHDAIDEGGCHVHVVELAECAGDSSTVLFGPHLERLERDGDRWRAETGRVYTPAGNPKQEDFTLDSIGMLPIAIRTQPA